MPSLPPFAWANLPASSLAQNESLTAAWNTLNAARGDLPFLTADALSTALATFGTGGERLLVGRSGSETAVMFVLVPVGRFRWQTFQPSQIPLGAWTAARDLLLPDLARDLIRGPLGFALSLSVTQIDPLFARRCEDTADTRSSDYIETGWIDFSGSFENYWSARGKNLRQNMRKQRNRLATEGLAGQMRALTLASDMAAAIERYGALESAGWKAAQGTAIHRDNAQGRFYRTLFENAAQHGEAIVFEYLFDDRVVASNLCLRRHGTLVVLKTTYDQSIQGYSPAFLLSQDALEYLHREESIRRLEYYGKMMDWHTKWTESKRTLYQLTVYRWPAVKQLAEWRRERARRATWKDTD